MSPPGTFTNSRQRSRLGPGLAHIHCVEHQGLVSEFVQEERRQVHAAIAHKNHLVIALSNAFESSRFLNLRLIDSGVFGARYRPSS